MYMFPTDLLDATLWNFSGHKYVDIDEFNDKVKQYQIRVSKEDTWDPETVIINASKIKIFYEVWEGASDDEEEDDEVRREIVIESNNKQYFTKGELLFKLHNAVVEDIRELDHIFFQGLHFVNDTDNIPLYFMSLGS